MYFAVGNCIAGTRDVMSVTRAMALVVAGALAMAGCGGSIASPSQPLTAQQVMAALAKHIPAVTPGVVYTAQTDPNHLLGRPGGYVSKTAFIDSRVSQSDVEGMRGDAVERGGSVEVFSDEQGAQNRVKYIQAIASGFPAAVEYDYSSGPVLVRVSRMLTPAQANEYQTTLKGIR
jgi:hypothetical protein